MSERRSCKDSPSDTFDHNPIDLAALLITHGVDLVLVDLALHSTSRASIRRRQPNNV